LDEYNRLRKELQSTLDREGRKSTAGKIQELAPDECFMIPVCEWPVV
jgi:ABC-type transport system substrate-binding protein